MGQPQRGSDEIAISVVSGTYNRLPLLKAMVESVRRSVGNLSYEIILVDGGSTDGTLEWCRSQSDVALVEQGELLGAIKAFNAGFAIARGHYVAILNDDIEINGDTLARAYAYLEDNPHVGMAAFRNVVPDNRGDHARIPVATAFGYNYGQCCLVRRWLGEWAGWWGNEGMRTYGGDTRLGLRLWEMGWVVTYPEGCSITDHVHVDKLREINSDAPWKHARERGEPHPDLVRFNLHWLNRLGPRQEHITAPVNRVLQKALQGKLRFLRFKGMMRATDPMRTALCDEMAQFGEVLQINQAKEQQEHAGRYHERTLEIVALFQPDLVMLQAQRQGSLVDVETVHEIRRRWPWVMIVNFDGDTHYPLIDWHFDIARAVHLQLVVSPSLFPQYAAQGISVAYWPIGVERAYLEIERRKPTGPDVVFLGSYYGEKIFPEGYRRGEVVLALAHSGLEFGLYGPGWERLGLPRAAYTMGRHADNAAVYARAKMGLSISQASDLWGYSSDRLYNICATGCPALVQRFAGMEEHGFTDDETCIAWTTDDELLEKARYYTAHDEEREAIGRAGREVVYTRHTWRQRVESLFAIIEGWAGC